MIVKLNSPRFRNCFYQKKGAGKPIFLVHGFGEDATIFENQIDQLQNTFELIIPDLPGSGLSPLYDEELSMELFADFIYEIAEQEKFQKRKVDQRAASVRKRSVFSGIIRHIPEP